MSTTPPTETPPAQPPASPPAGTPPVTPPAVPPAAGAQGGGGKNKGRPNGGKTPPKEIRIPVNAFKSRVNREAANIVKARLGISIEEAEAIVKKTGVQPSSGQPAGSANATAQAALDQYQADLKKLQRQKDDAEKRASSWENKHKKDTRRLKDAAIENELKLKANQAGINDVDYAIHLFARAAASGQSTDPAAYFAGLKTSHPHLFAASAAPVPAPAAPATPPTPPSVPANTAPPESEQPGEKKPDPAAPGGATSGPSTVDTLPPHEFARRTRAQYGFTPSM